MSILNIDIDTDTITDTVSSIGTETVADAGAMEETRKIQAKAVGPSSVAYEHGIARAGEDWVKCLFVSTMPGTIPPGMIDVVNTHPNMAVEPVIHFNPTEPQSMIEALGTAINKLKMRLLSQQEKADPDVDQTKREILNHKYIRNLLQTGNQKLFNVGVYIRIRGASKDAVDSEYEAIKRELDKSEITLKTIDYQSDDALTTTSPIAKDQLDGATGQMLGDAVGSLFPFSASTLYEDDGILLGYHATTNEPFQLDRWNREGGYNALTIGDLGSGKTFGTELLLMRRLALDPDTVLVMIDPDNSFAPLAREVGAKQLPLGSERGLNPLELRPTPDAVLAEQENSPFDQWFRSSLEFFSTYFEFIGTDATLTRKENVVLQTALRQTAWKNGITEDPDTHTNPSPTPLQVRQTLNQIGENPVAFFESSDTATDTGGGENAMPDSVSIAPSNDPEAWADAASTLHMAMEPFATGAFRAMGGHSDINMESKATHIILNRTGTPQEQALRLQSPLNAVYQRAVQSDKQMIIAIDEVHRLFNTEASLEGLEMIARDSRHADISMQFISQHARDFFSHPRAESLAKLCSHMFVHRESNFTHDPHGKKLGLSPTEAKFARTMKKGTPERGWAHAMVSVDDHGTYPIKVKPLRDELMKLDPDLPSGGNP